MWEKRRILRQFNKYETVIIYGAGGVGKTVANWLKSENKPIHCFAVSDKKKDQDVVEGIPVRQIDELCDLKENSIVIVATLENLHADIRATLEKFGFKNQIYTTKKLLDAIGVIEVNGFFPEKRASFYRMVNKLARQFFKGFKCKNVLVFETRIDYTDNGRALSEYIEENLSHKYKIVWLVKEPEKMPKDAKITCINRNKMSVWNLVKFNYYLSVAKFIFFTHPWWLSEWKKEQTVVNLGHGNPLKEPERVVKVPAEFVLASGDDGVKFRKKEYAGDVKVVVLGPPRNDWLFRKCEDILKPYIGENVYKKVVLCLPTFKQYVSEGGKISRVKFDSRETNEFCINTIDSVKKLEDLNETLKQENVVFLCKEHYMQQKSEHENMSNIIYIDNEMLKQNGHDIYHLMAQADALVTDFSSIFMDYLLLERPIGFFCNTFEQYDRGFTMDNPQDYMAGKKIYNNIDLEDFVKSVVEGTDNFAAERKVARDLVFKYQDNQNCKRCVEYFGL